MKTQMEAVKNYYEKSNTKKFFFEEKSRTNP